LGDRGAAFPTCSDEICQRLWKHEQGSRLGYAHPRGYAHDLGQRARTRCDDAVAVAVADGAVIAVAVLADADAAAVAVAAVADGNDVHWQKAAFRYRRFPAVALRLD